MSRITAEMVATRAGTSVSTVSLVVNGKDRGRVSPALRERVLLAVDELGYVVDHTASALAKGSTDLVLLIIPDPGNPFFTQVIRGARQCLDGRYRLLVAVTRHGEQPTPQDVADHLAFRPAGLLVDAPVPDFLSGFPDGPPVPTVLLDSPGSASSVNFRLRQGVEELVAHIAEQGHRTFAYLDSSAPATTYDRRRELLREAAEARGLTMLSDVASSPVTVADAADTAAARLPEWRDAGASAVVAATDILAYGVLSAAADAGIDVPRELAVAGFDDLPGSAVTGPPLTSVALSGDELGRASASALLAAIDGTAAPTSLDEIPTRLIVRGSTLGART